jgi:hypothetical protein
MPLVFLGKILVAFILLFLTAGLFRPKPESEKYCDIILFLFITLPTIFVVYIKSGFIKDHQKFLKPWKFLRVIYGIIIALFIVLTTVGCYRLYHQTKAVQVYDFVNFPRNILAAINYKDS